MAAYVIVDAEVLDAAGIPAYVALAEPSIARHGGRFLIQGTEPALVPEGTYPAGQLVTVLEFPDMQRLREWYDSDEYQKAIAVRQKALKIRMLHVEGMASS